MKNNALKISLLLCITLICTTVKADELSSYENFYGDDSPQPDVYYRDAKDYNEKLEYFKSQLAGNNRTSGTYGLNQEVDDAANMAQQRAYEESQRRKAEYLRSLNDRARLDLKNREYTASETQRALAQAALNQGNLTSDERRALELMITEGNERSAELARQQLEIKEQLDKKQSHGSDRQAETGSSQNSNVQRGTYASEPDHSDSFFFRN